MWFSLEARVPFLDHRLVERTLALKGKNLIINGMTKSIFRDAMKEIIPEKIRLRRDKIGFDTPQDEWYRGEIFKNLVYEVLMPGSFITEYFVQREKAITLYNKHLLGEIDISKEIWKWIHLELWHQEFLS